MTDTPTMAEQIRALIAAHPDTFTARDLVALLPAHPHDVTDRLRLRRVNNQVYPLLKDRLRLGPVLVRNPDRTLRLARPIFDVSPEAQAARARAAKDRQNAKRRALTAQGQGRHLIDDRRRQRTRTARKSPRPATPPPLRAAAFNAPIEPPRTAARAAAAIAPAPTPLPCTETFLRANPDKLEVLPTFWSRP